MSTFKPHKLLSAETFGALVLDFLTFGNGYLELQRSRTGKPLELKHALAKYVRRGTDLETYYFVRGWRDEHQFTRVRHQTAVSSTFRRLDRLESTT
ncbi:hypothetical protein OU995_16665 [Roseateles sp. SL47]|uniref:hypothetical protein n=1 Tax=Roseateles sp. SL47 TaxID=2995138 RepID=UPI00226F0BD9|nr:hypothetical protein [Roseateles sp. SL47]WAC71219.1 hypothetical protein OU995_16665 [Roseateles sp. SL47]